MVVFATGSIVRDFKLARTRDEHVVARDGVLVE